MWKILECVCSVVEGCTFYIENKNYPLTPAGFCFTWTAVVLNMRMGKPNCCLVGVSFYPDGISFCPLSSSGQEKGCFWAGLTFFFLHVHIPKKGVWLVSKKQGMEVVFWAKWTPSGQNETHLGNLYESGQSALELGEKNFNHNKRVQKRVVMFMVPLHLVHEWQDIQSLKRLPWVGVEVMPVLCQVIQIGANKSHDFQTNVGMLQRSYLFLFLWWLGSLCCLAC